MTDKLIVTIGCCPPKTVSPNHRSANWWAKTRGSRQFREAALIATSEAARIPLRLVSGSSFAQGPYTAPDWLLPAYAAADRARTTHQAMPVLLVLDAVVLWPVDRRRMDDDGVKASLKAAIDGLATAIDLNDRTFRVGRVTQERAPKDDVPAWLHGRTTLTLRPLTPKERLP